MKKKNSITKDEIRLLPLGYFEGETVVVKDNVNLEKAITILETEKVIGIDTETKPNFVKGKFNRVALLQLSTKTTCFLFPLVRYGLSKEVKSILESTDIIKVGVATQQDMKELKRDYGVRAQNLLDLNRMAKSRGYRNVGVRNLAGLMMGIRISKSKQMSNWESDPLDAGQIRYASTDAWVCLKIYQILNDQAKSSRHS